MQRTSLRAGLALTALTLLAGSLSAQDRVVGQEVVPGRRITLTKPVADRPEMQLKRDIEVIARAMKTLDERGFSAESKQLRAALQQLEAQLRPKSVEERAEALLAGDIQDRAVRVGIIELVAEGYDAAGWETNAGVMRWFASVGRNQVEGNDAPLPPMPESLSGRSGNLMDNLTQLVLGGAGMHHTQRHPSAAEACLRLGKFYVQRGLGAFATEPGRDRASSPEAPEEPAEIEAEEIEELEPDRDARVGALRGLGYVGGDAVALDDVTNAAETLSSGYFFDNGPADHAALVRRELELKVEHLRAQLAELEAQVRAKRAAEAKKAEAKERELEQAPPSDPAAPKPVRQR